jgi:hypothetical protein
MVDSGSVHARKRSGSALYRRSSEEGEPEPSSKRLVRGIRGPEVAEPCWLSAGRPGCGGSRWQRARHVHVTGRSPLERFGRGVGVA